MGTTDNESNWTRREAVQGLVGIASAAMLPMSGVAGETADSAWSEEATHISGRMQTFNEGWRFYRGDAQGADATDFNDSNWRTLDVPHDWSIEDLPSDQDNSKDAVWVEGVTPLHEGPFDLYASEGQMATGWTVGGVGWYRKTFARPEIPTGGKAELRFEGVYMNSDVWVNGVHLGNHPYGYTEFAYDVTPYLKEGTNTVAVRVNNTGRNSRWYSGSGIYRKVWLSVAGSLRIPAHGVYVTTPEVSKDAAQVQAQITIENGSGAARRVDLRVRLLDPTGKPAGEARGRASVPANDSVVAPVSLRLTRPQLWSPGDPHLYRAEVTLEADGKREDAAALEVGVRKVEMDAMQGLRINGESVKLRGGCVHHANGPLGSAAIPRAEERRVELMKANGFNAIRTSHNPPSPDFLRTCDRLGMLVIDEAFDCWEAGNKNPQDYHLYFKEWWKRDLDSMILRDRNHPCIILWSIGNEINERAEPQGIAIGKALQARVHELDPTRKVTAAICMAWDHPHQTWQDQEPAFTYLDVGGYNYTWQEYEKDHAKYPERVMVGTESFPLQVYENWDAVEKDSWVIGDFVWTAIDYLGESGIGHSSIHNGPGADSFNGPYPWFNSYCGDIDLIGNKKPQSYFRDVVWRRSPVEMAVQRPLPNGWTEHVSLWGWSDELRSWTWPGLEDQPVTVRVYTRGDKVQLLLNGKEVGTKDLTEKNALRAEFAVPYAAGELKAVAYEDGKQIGTISFATVGRPHSLKLMADKTKLKSSRDELSYVMVQVVDAQGRPVPDAVVPIAFSISGPGEIAAVGNGNPKEVASFRQARRNTFHGSCVAIVRPKGSAGVVELRAESPKLGTATTSVRVQG